MKYIAKLIAITPKGVCAEKKNNTMTKLKTIDIRGRSYVTVATRVEAFHEAYPTGSITTEVLLHSPVVVKATVTVPKGTFTGISAANPNKLIEKMSPYEVAETSAVGRALGFAGIGITDSIASADEMVKATTPMAEMKHKKSQDVGKDDAEHDVGYVEEIFHED